MTFTDTSSGIITNWSWTFGDGGMTNLTTAGVAHTYNTQGIYSVTEIVTGPGGSSTNTASNYITVLPPVAPLCRFLRQPNQWSRSFTGDLHRHIQWQHYQLVLDFR